MTRRIAPILALLGALAGFVGCGDHRLTVAGHARFDTGDSFDFPNDIRIDSGGNVTGTCLITRSVVDGAIQRGIVVDIFSGGTGGTRSFTVTARDDGSPGSVSARLQAGTFASTAACQVAVSYVDDGGSVTLDSTDCALASEGSQTAVDLHLELHGCDVQ